MLLNERFQILGIIVYDFWMLLTKQHLIIFGEQKFQMVRVSQVVT